MVFPAFGADRHIWRSVRNLLLNGTLCHHLYGFSKYNDKKRKVKEACPTVTKAL